MSENPADGTRPQADDYEYDEAHVDRTGTAGRGPARRPVQPADVPVGDSGDYGYDEAHDLHRS